MSSSYDFIEYIRRFFIPPVGFLVQKFNACTGTDLFVEGETTSDQYACSLNLSEEELERVLESLGFSRNPLSSFKRLRIGKVFEYEEGSWRWTDGDMQLHVVLYDGNPGMNNATGEMHLYAHWEYRWDVYPLKHYRGEEYDAMAGVTRLRDILEQNDIPYHRRKVSPADL